MPRSRSLASLAVAIAVAALAPPARAAVIGGTGAEIGCPSEQFIDFGTQAEVASAGLLSSFSYESSTTHPSATIVFDVLRRVEGFDYRVVGTSEAVVDPGDGDVHTVWASIEVHPGDRLGIYVGTPGWECSREQEGGAIAAAPAGHAPATGDIMTTENEFDELALNVSANVGDAAALISGSGLTANGGAFDLDIRGSAAAPAGTATVGDVTGTVSCVGFRDDGRDATFGRRGVFGIKTSNSRYIEFYVQDLPRDRIVRTGTSRTRLHTAPPPGCYHATPLALQRQNTVTSGAVTVRRPARGAG